ncbi:hypothetical protein H2248_004445 [Termitomyces sp. 'cryptogamus']|nr:hypothetical protein H2248_004445 [Termitomyces sp. 'cryptogamus']
METPHDWPPNGEAQRQGSKRQLAFLNFSHHSFFVPRPNLSSVITGFSELSPRVQRKSYLAIYLEVLNVGGMVGRRPMTGHQMVKRSDKAGKRQFAFLNLSHHSLSVPRPSLSSVVTGFAELSPRAQRAI